MFCAFGCTHVANFGTKCTNFFHARSVASYRRHAQPTYLSTFQVERNTVGEGLHIGFFKARCNALQARNCACIAGFNTCFLNLIHHFITPVKVTPKIRALIVTRLISAVRSTTAQVSLMFLLGLRRWFCTWNETIFRSSTLEEAPHSRFVAIHILPTRTPGDALVGVIRQH